MNKKEKGLSIYIFGRVVPCSCQVDKKIFDKPVVQGQLFIEWIRKPTVTRSIYKRIDLFTNRVTRSMKHHVRLYSN